MGSYFLKKQTNKKNAWQQRALVVLSAYQISIYHCQITIRRRTEVLTT